MRFQVKGQRLHGVMVQQKGSALLEENDIHHNYLHGVFIGYVFLQKKRRGSDFSLLLCYSEPNER